MMNVLSARNEPAFKCMVEEYLLLNKYLLHCSDRREGGESHFVVVLKQKSWRNCSCSDEQRVDPLMRPIPVPLPTMKGNGRAMPIG